MRRRRLNKRLRELQQQNLTRDELLLKLGAARKEAGKAYALLVIYTPTKDQPVTSETFHFALDRGRRFKSPHHQHCRVGDAGRPILAVIV